MKYRNKSPLLNMVTSMVSCFIFMVSTFSCLSQDIILNDPQIISVLISVSEHDINQSKMFNDTTNCFDDVHLVREFYINKAEYLLNGTYEIIDQLILSPQPSILNQILYKYCFNENDGLYKYSSCHSGVFLNEKILFYIKVLDVIDQFLMPQVKNKILFEYLNSYRTIILRLYEYSINNLSNIKIH